MNPAIERMLAKHDTRSADSALRALREILQELVLLGLWRAKFFERAAFYGGTALRILHGLDRFSEDLDFSLLAPDPGFDLTHYSGYLEEELLAFGFHPRIELVNKAVASPIRSAFLKADTRNELLAIEVPGSLSRSIPRGQTLKIRIEVDTDPPGGFSTEARYVLLPIPFSVRACALPDLFAGKMHALLFRRWKTRVKGRDWHDFVWFAANHPELRLAHLEQRMRQTGDWTRENRLTSKTFQALLRQAITALDVGQARNDVVRFLRRPEDLDIWSKDFFMAVAEKIRPI